MSCFYRLCDTETSASCVYHVYTKHFTSSSCASLPLRYRFWPKQRPFRAGVIFFQTINPTVKRTTTANPDRTDNRFWFSWNAQQWSINNGIVPWQISVCVLSEKTIVSLSFLGWRMERSLWGGRRDATTDDYFVRHFIHIARLRRALIYFVFRCNRDYRPFYCWTLLGAFVIDKRWYHVERRPGEEIQRFDIFWK